MGHDVRYLTSGHAHGGNAGAMSYYTASGEPAGQWGGQGVRCPGAVRDGGREGDGPAVHGARWPGRGAADPAARQGAGGG